MKTSGCNYKDYVLLNVQRIVKVKVKISKMKIILQKNKNIYLHVMGYWYEEHIHSSEQITFILNSPLLLLL